MNSKFIRKTIIPLALLVVFVSLFPVSALGQGPGINFPDIPSGNQVDPRTILGLILNIVWIMSVTFVVVFFIIGGFKFITAKGDPFELQTARRWLIWAIVGVAVILLAWVIVVSIKATFGL